ncbi:MAG: hypothetical protein SH850_15270 [Planctomycetaceae bacterium]|nr:hypothetical protein [Planctomycetaceae bacterium]
MSDSYPAGMMETNTLDDASRARKRLDANSAKINRHLWIVAAAARDIKEIS